jgi:hypothetical protein
MLPCFPSKDVEIPLQEKTKFKFQNKIFVPYDNKENLKITEQNFFSSIQLMLTYPIGNSNEKLNSCRPSVKVSLPSEISANKNQAFDLAALFVPNPP